MSQWRRCWINRRRELVKTTLKNPQSCSNQTSFFRLFGQILWWFICASYRTTDRQWKIKASLKLWEQWTQVTEADENPSPTTLRCPAPMATTPDLVWMQSSRLLHSNHQTGLSVCVPVCCFGHANTQLDNNRPSATECNHTLTLPQIVNIMHLCLLSSAPLNLQLCNGQGVH